MDKGVPPVPALATTRAAEVEGRAMPLPDTGGSDSSAKPRAEVDQVDRGVSPVPALATTRATEITRRAVALLGTGGSESSNNNSNTSMIEAGQPRTGEVSIRGTSTGSRRKLGRGRIQTSMATADIRHGRHTETVAAGETSRGRRYVTHASSAAEDPYLVPTVRTMPPVILLTYVGCKAPTREYTLLTPAQGVTGAAR